MMTVLAVSAHTDDVELGCGGTLSKLREQGEDIIMIAFSGNHELETEFKKAAKHLNATPIMMSYMIRHLGKSRQEILDKLINMRSEYKPNLVIAPSLNDFHQDHQVIAREVIRAFKTSASIICYELPWNHIQFNTQLFVRLNKKNMGDKWEMLKEYKTQKKRSYFKKDFVYGLSRVRGVQCNSIYAEAFEVVRWMI